MLRACYLFHHLIRSERAHDDVNLARTPDTLTFNRVHVRRVVSNPLRNVPAYPLCVYSNPLRNMPAYPLCVYSNPLRNMPTYPLCVYSDFMYRTATGIEAHDGIIH